MNVNVPRGTAVDQTILYTGGPLSGYELRRIERAAGYAHIDRMAVDGGPIVEPAPIRRRLVLHAMAGLVGVAGGTIAVIMAVLAILGIIG